MVRLKKTKKAKAELEKKSKDRIKDVVTHLTPTNSLSKDDDDDRPQWQKDVLFGRRRKMEAIEEDGEANAEETAKENGDANHESAAREDDHAKHECEQNDDPVEDGIQRETDPGKRDSSPQSGEAAGQSAEENLKNEISEAATDAANEDRTLQEKEMH